MKKMGSFLKMAGFAFAMFASVIIFSLSVYAAGNITVSVSSAYVRASASTSSATVGGVLKGETYAVIDSEKVGDYTWYKITLKDGNTGYVRGDLVTYSGDSTSTSTSTSASVAETNVKACNPVEGTVVGSVNVRAQASTKSSKITSTNSKATVTVIGYATGSDNKVWYQVTFESAGKTVTGFIRSDYVTLSGELKDYTEPEPEPEVEPEPEPEVKPEPEPEPVYSDYEAVYSPEEECWFLNDYENGKRTKINDLYEAGEKLAKAEAAHKKALSKKNGTIVVLILIIVLLLIGAGVIFIRFRQWYFGGDEETEEPVRTTRDTKPASDTSKVAQSTGKTGVQVQTIGQGGTVTPKPKTSQVVNGKLPNGGIMLPDGRVQMPDGSIRRAVTGVRLPDGTIKLPDGRICNADGTPVSKPDAKPVTQDTVSIMKAGSSTQSVREVPIKGIKPSGEDDDMEFGFLNYDDGSSEE